ncbi:S8 family serine peptidase [Streptomyces sp. NBC_00234]|uniref:S8 family serine peptidase n=1 Tax=Streptomyces sp. NBC_00234 TaxID=2903638 RepID=UPI002E2CC12B|nr:S8 family serine peptidase [Streptomyces sp. NBC_00234]
MPPFQPRRTRRRLAAVSVVLAATAALPGVTGAPGARAATGATGFVPTGAASSAPVTVTLVTGDTVTLVPGPDGKPQAAVVPAPGGAPRTFQVINDADGDLYVIPSDAADGIATQAVDRELFNVTRLVEDGYADGRAKSLPVIVGYADGPSDATLSRRADALPSATTGAVLKRSDMAGQRVTKEQAGRFWRSVRPVSKSPRRGRPVTAPGTSGVSRLWYDAKVEAVLDKSVPQIGAPQAWAKGYDGKGVKVAVLDTGVDLTNADVKDRIAAQQSFVPDQDVQDGQGHGTHVASTIAGSGANSGGAYKGVAPSADLLVGKVLNNAGQGQSSWILAGMEWAAAMGADVVSMSLGGSTASASDPMTEAVDRLSAATGTLFVIAAGNSGPGGRSIGTPGTADSALTVGAVDKSEGLAAFSSRGPRPGDFAIKPDITAPGVNIVAARAAGTSIGTPVDANYTALNGTSMATPHVAGAAAILAQRHPDWSGERIKSALTATSKVNAGQTVYQQGNGRVDVAAALDPALEIAGRADFGYVMYQESGTYEKQTRTVTLSNTGDAALTVKLDMALSGGLPAGAVTLSAASATIPAHGTTDVTATLDATAVADGQYGGTITATADNGVTAHTVVGLVKQPPQHRINLTVTDRFGNPAGAGLFGLNLDTGALVDASVGAGGGELSLPAGRYSFQGQVVTRRVPSGNAMTGYATDVFAIQETDIREGDRSITIDGTKAEDVAIDPVDEDRPLERSSMSFSTTRTSAARVSVTQLMANTTHWMDMRWGAIPTTGSTTVGKQYAQFSVASREPLIRARVTRPDSFAITAKTSSLQAGYADGTRSFDVVDAGGGTAEDLAKTDVRGKAALLHFTRFTGALAAVKSLAAAGAAAIVLVPADDSPQLRYTPDVTVPYFTTDYDEGRRLATAVAEGRTTISLTTVQDSRYTYRGARYYEGIPKGLRIKAGREDFTRVKSAYHSDVEDRRRVSAVLSSGTYPVANAAATEPVVQGRTRDDHLLTDDTIQYQRLIYAPGSAVMYGPAKSYRPGTTVDETWFAPAMHPAGGHFGPCAFCRTDLGTVFSPATGGDSDAGHFMTGGISRSWSAYRNGERIEDSTQLFVPEPAVYRLISDDERPANTPGTVLGGKVRTEWTFNSAAPKAMTVDGCSALAAGITACEALPVVVPHYTMPVDLHNQARAGTAYAFTVQGLRATGFEGGTRMAGAKVWISSDDGATWRSVRVDRTDDRSFRAMLVNPGRSEGNGFVSVRAEIWDAAGNRSLQTITRAYALR